MKKILFAIAATGFVFVQAIAQTPAPASKSPVKATQTTAPATNAAPAAVSKTAPMMHKEGVHSKKAVHNVGAEKAAEKSVAPASNKK